MSQDALSLPIRSDFEVRTQMAQYLLRNPDSDFLECAVVLGLSGMLYRILFAALKGYGPKALQAAAEARG